LKLTVRAMPDVGGVAVIVTGPDAVTGLSAGASEMPRKNGPVPLLLGTLLVDVATISQSPDSTVIDVPAGGIPPN
jgi:hypothetical protein